MSFGTLLKEQDRIRNRSISGMLPDSQSSLFQAKTAMRLSAKKMLDSYVQDDFSLGRISARIRTFTVTAALLYRHLDPGAYGDITQALGWHFETGVFVARPLEIALQVAHLIPDLDSSRPGDIETAVALNAFPDSGRMRVQLEYAYLAVLAEEGIERDAHRVVVQWQALY